MTSTRSLGRPDPAAETCFVDEPRHGDRLADDSALFIRMNDLVVQNGVVIPVLWRNGVAVAATKLRGLDLSGWDTYLWRLPYWYKA